MTRLLAVLVLALAIFADLSAPALADPPADDVRCGACF